MWQLLTLLFRKSEDENKSQREKILSQMRLYWSQFQALFIIMQNLSYIFLLFWHQRGRLITWLQSKNEMTNGVPSSLLF